MVFSSFLFLLLFLPALLAVYYLIPARCRGARNLALLGFSLVFYACGGVKYLPLLLLSVLINYASGLFAGAGHAIAVRKAAVFTAAALGLALLGYFKYAGFFAGIAASLGAGITVPQIVLPVGISFYTFQGLSYVIDVYRGDAPVQKNPLNVALYVTLFPQLVAGPIVRYTTVAQSILSRRETLSQFSGGVERLCFGLGKKMLVANAMGAVADQAFSCAPGTLFAWVGAIAYTFQIYFDFSAYSDMAIGLGRLFGFEFLENFNYPYVSRSVTEFWRRWHISLSSWFRDYIYIPLGGSRGTRAKTVRNIAVVWLLTGLWHGASWNFVLWGAWFLVLLLGEKFLWGGALQKAPRAAAHAYTMLAVTLSWVLFRAADLAQCASYLRAMFGANGAARTDQAVYLLLEYCPEFLLALVFSLPVAPALRALLERRSSRTARFLLDWGVKLAALAVLALSYDKLVTGSFNPFIYFQF